MISKRLLSKVVLPAILLLLTHTVLAQKVVTGKVTDSKDGTPVSGASVRPKGGGGGTTTSADGTYRITVSESTKALLISYVGFGDMEVDITGKTTADAALTTSNSSLNEVVVVGYGTARRKDLTGAVSSVQSKDFNKGQINSPSNFYKVKLRVCKLPTVVVSRAA